MPFHHALLAVMLACTASAAVAATGPTPPVPAPSPTPATAAPPAAAAPTAATAPADPDEKVCKVEREIGSNRLKRVCRTRAQIDNEQAAAREALSREQKN